MAKRQTRRSVSMNGDLYHRLESYCAYIDQPVARFVGMLVTGWLNRHEVDHTLSGQSPSTCLGEESIDHG